MLRSRGRILRRSGGDDLLTLQVVVATTEFAPFRGGLASYSELLARGLATRGVGVEVLAPQYPDAPNADAIGPVPVRRFSLRSARFFLRRRWILTLALWRATRSRTERPVVIATTYLFAQVAALLTLGFPRRFRLIVTVCGPELIGFGLWSPRDWWRRAVMQLLGWRASAIICISQYTRGLALRAGLPPCKCHVVFVGVSLETFRRGDGSAWRRRALGTAEGPLLLTVGRLERRKGHDVALQAVAMLREEFPGLRYVIIGVGPEEGRLRDLARGLRIEEHVLWYGRAEQAELRQAYSAADVFLFPTRQEGRSVEAQGLVIIEAGLCGAAVAVGRHGGAVEIVTHERTGLLFDPEDAAAAATAVGRLLRDPALRRRLGQSAETEWRSRFGVDTMVAETIRVFRSD
ncbi:MAG: glycosyltransferase family 4 protein [Chloroflexi bacterium]|nr:MAG: glycosyltransferase family 4 protein [Chloroflexota bacterium]